MNSFTVYTQPGCPFCTKAIKLLKSQSQAVNTIDIAQNPDAREEMRTNGFRTVPQVYHNSDHIGGYEALVDYLEVANAQ